MLFETNDTPLCHMKINPTKFKGHNVLFIHTGMSTVDVHA